jgi:predicted flap endonuclease-1-like 5' DNA nuclease
MKGKAIWALGFLTLLSAANVINALIMWFNLGPEGTFRPYLLAGIVAAFPVYAYLLISVLITLAFLGELSNKEQINALTERMGRFESGQQTQQKTLEGIQAKMFLVDESLERTRKEFSNRLAEQANHLEQSVEKGHQTQQRMLDAVQSRVFLLDESLKKVNTNLDKVAPQLAEIKETSTRQFKEMETALEQVQQHDKKTVATVTKQADEITEIRLKLDRLEAELTKPKPLLTSQSNVEDVKGIGPIKGAELREIGITNAGELIMADTKLVADRMGSTEKTVEKLQGRAQLAMIPGLKDKDLLLLEDLDINDRKNLAEQDPIDLSKKINAVFKVNVAQGKIAEGDKPTIEEIESWVKFVKSY